MPRAIVRLAWTMSFGVRTCVTPTMKSVVRLCSSTTMPLTGSIRSSARPTPTAQVVLLSSLENVACRLYEFER